MCWALFIFIKITYAHITLSNPEWMLQGVDSVPYTGSIKNYLEDRGLNDADFEIYPLEATRTFKPVTTFNSIPFADPPNRFEKSTKFTNKNGFFRTGEVKQLSDKLGPMCPQNTNDDRFTQSEDCLQLNIYAPTNSLGTKEKLPVYVWIHGGSYDTGTAVDIDGRFLTSAFGIIVVTINYRLNIFGFMEPNHGLYDQRMGLEWVKAEISNFNGDPDNIILAGESAGGASVAQQLTYDALVTNGHGRKDIVRLNYDFFKYFSTMPMAFIT